MYIIQANDGRIWNWLLQRWDLEMTMNGHMYISEHNAKKAAIRVSSLQGSTFEGLEVKEYGKVYVRE
jgi:hypothetical protein